MKAFRFPLESVLDARRAQESEARQQLALALEKHREAATRSGEAAAALDRLLEEIAGASSRRFSVAEREHFGLVRLAQERVCAETRAAEQECARFAEVKRTAAIEARRQRELLERLKTSRREAWQKEAARAEQHQFDEFAMSRRYQASQQAQALC